MNFKMYYELLGGHAHVKVFANGGMCGSLVFRIEEWEAFKKQLPNSIEVLETTI